MPVLYIHMIHAHLFQAVYKCRKVVAQLLRQGWTGIRCDQVLHVIQELDIQGTLPAGSP